MEHLQREWHASRERLPVRTPIVGLACAPIVETRFLELAMSLLDFSPRIPLGTFSILLSDTLENVLNKMKRVQNVKQLTYIIQDNGALCMQYTVI